MQADSRKGRKEEESTWKKVVLIPKGGIEYYEIGLAEVVWKVVNVILNNHIATSNDFHDVLHNFWAGHGTGTTSLEAKLLQQLISMR